MDKSHVRGRKMRSRDLITQAVEEDQSLVTQPTPKKESTIKKVPKQKVAVNKEEISKESTISLDDLLNTDEDQFDIDEFIRSVKGVG